MMSRSSRNLNIRFVTKSEEGISPRTESLWGPNMVASFFAKHRKILIIEPSASARGTLVEAVRDAGGSGVDSVDGFKNALSLLEVEEFDWILCPVRTREAENAAYLLKALQGEPELRTTNVSVVAQPEDHFYIPYLFEIGLLSWHSRRDSQEACRLQICSLANAWLDKGGKETRIAGEFLHGILVSLEARHSLCDLLGTLAQFSPGDAALFSRWAGALVSAGVGSDARDALEIARDLGGTGWREVERAMLSYGFKLPAEGRLGNVLIVEPDEMTRISYERSLGGIGDTNVTFCADADAAWALLEDPEVAWDLVVTEWKLPSLSGAAFLQRIHAAGIDVPVVIVSSVPNKHDLALISEIGVASVLGKPFDRVSLPKRLASARSEHQFPTSARALERKIALAASGGAEGTARNLLGRMRADFPNGTSSHHVGEAYIHFAGKRWRSALHCASKALEREPGHVRAIHLMGRALLKLRDFPGAFKCFLRADALSGRNVERLCFLAECGLASGESAQWRVSLERARFVDAASDHVLRVEARAAISSGEVDIAASFSLTENAKRDLVAALNGDAVALVLSSDYGAAVRLYTVARSFIGTNGDEICLKLAYNLALALARWGKLGDADRALRSVAISPADRRPIALKLLALRTRVAEAHKRGVKGFAVAKVSPSSLEGGDASIGNEAPGNQPLPGDSRLAGLFNATKDGLATSRSFGDDAPRFRRRKSVAINADLAKLKGELNGGQRVA